VSELFFLQDTGVSPPVNTAVPTISGTAQVGATLTATTGTWTNSPTGYAYQWRRCNAAGSSCADITGAVTSTYVLTSADQGSTIRVVVTATNAGGSASATSAQTAVIAAQPAPVNTVLPVISGNAQVGSVLSTTTGTWTNDPTSYTYQWRRCNSSGASCSNISGATLGVYVLTSADEGQTIRVVVTATNPGGSTAATSAQTAVIAAAPPEDLTFLSLGDNLPTVQVAIAMAGPGGETFGSGPASSPSSPTGMGFPDRAGEFSAGEESTPGYPISLAWLNVNAYVRSFSLTRGRQDELGRVATGTLNVVLDNRDRRFDPTYTSGSHYGQLEPMRRIRVQAQWDGEIYNLFSGYIEGWPQSYPGQGHDAVVEITASDAFKVLNLYDLADQEYSEQRSDERMLAVLSDAGYIYGEYVLSPGQSTVAASGTITSTSALSHLLEVDKSEQGLFFINGGGTVIFQDRHYRTKNQQSVVATLGTATGEIPYRDIETQYDDQRLWNIARVTPAGGTAEVSINAASTATYYPRVLTSESLSPSQNDALALAHYYTYTYAAPKLRVPRVDLVVGSTVANPTPLWATVLARELSDRVMFKLTPPAGGTITADQHLESITVRANKPRGEFDVSWLLSPVNPHQYWRLGHPQLGRLGVTSRVGF
jgi:hypothetical protein